MFNAISLKLFCLFLLSVLVGCSGVQTFPSAARSGDTVIVPAGWKKNFSRDDITVIITPSVGAPITYQPGNTAVRAVINLFLDPLSSLIISGETNQDMTPFGRTYADSVYGFVGGYKDVWQTTVFVDLPDTLPTGFANIEIINSQGSSAESSLEIIEGIGDTELFDADLNGPLSSIQLQAMERVEHFVISFSGSVIPHAIQVEFRHDGTEEIGGSGKTYVSNPRGDLKSISWNDDGNNLRVILMPSQLELLESLNDFDFYVAGGVSNLLLDSILAVDANGVPVEGIVANIATQK